jgi:pentatricopeptide repeat protein
MDGVETAEEAVLSVAQGVLRGGDEEPGILFSMLYHMRYELIFSLCFVVLLLVTRRKAETAPVGKSVGTSANAWELMNTIVELCSTKYGKAMDLFLDAEDSMFDRLPEHEYLRLVSALALASVRVGRAERLSLLFAKVRHRGPSDPGVISPVMRMLSSRHQFSQAVKALDNWESTFQGQEVPVTAMSCAVHCAVECGSEERALDYLKKLEQRGEVTLRDYSAVIRLFAQSESPEKAMRVLEEMEARGLKPDNVSYNMVLSACANARQKDQVNSLLSNMEADVVTYNTRLKACAQERDVQAAFAIFADLEAAGIAPTQVTYGTLVECCTRAGEMAKAREVLQRMGAAGVAKNIVVYTSLIKGFAALGKLEEAMEVFEEMQSSGDGEKAERVEPDVICYSALIKAFCDRQDLEQAFHLLENLLEKGHTPDEILFNHLLAGCTAKPHVQLAEKILNDMVAHGIKPTTATFSTMLKVYSKAQDIAASAAFLESIPATFGTQPAQRLYCQHISWAIRTRKGASAVQVFKLMVQRLDRVATNCDPTLVACQTFNMLDTAVALLEVDASRFSAGAREQVVDVLVKKRRDNLLERANAAIAALEQ